MKQTLERLTGKGSVVKENIRLAPYTTMKVGGEADYFVEVKTSVALERSRVEPPLFPAGARGQYSDRRYGLPRGCNPQHRRSSFLQ